MTDLRAPGLPTREEIAAGLLAERFKRIPPEAFIKASERPLLETPELDGMRCGLCNLPETFMDTTVDGVLLCSPCRTIFAEAISSPKRAKDWRMFTERLREQHMDWFLSDRWEPPDLDKYRSAEQWYADWSAWHWGYTTTVAFRRLRLQALELADHKCELCGKGGKGAGLQAHHLTYDRLGCERLADLMILCRTCHKAEHDLDDEEEERGPRLVRRDEPTTSHLPRQRSGKAGVSVAQGQAAPRRAGQDHGRAGMARGGVQPTLAAPGGDGPDAPRRVENAAAEGDRQRGGGDSPQPDRDSAAAQAVGLDDRCPRCKQVDYLPLDDLEARCYRCKTVYRRREAPATDCDLGPRVKPAGWSAGLVLRCPACGHQAYVQEAGTVRRCWGCGTSWDPERPSPVVQEERVHA